MRASVRSRSCIGTCAKAPARDCGPVRDLAHALGVIGALCYRPLHGKKECILALGHEFKGSIVALVTPFDGDRVDEAALADLVAWHVSAGTHGIVPCGTTGESPTLSHQEHMQVIETVISAANGAVPIIAGTGSNATAEAIALTRHAADAGADGALIVTPYYNKPTQAGLYAHFAALDAAVSDFPLIIYNIPGRSIVDMSVETMGQLAQLPNIIGVKDATANLLRVRQQEEACGADFVQLSGEDATALAFMMYGGQGCISVTANVAPALCAEFQNACLAGDYEKARTVHDHLMPLHDALFVETSPGPVKYAMQRIGKCSHQMRLPMVDIAPDSARVVDAALERVGLI